MFGLVLRLGGLRSSGGGGLHDWRRYNRGVLYRCDSRLGWVAVIDDRALDSSAQISAVWTTIVKEKKPTQMEHWLGFQVGHVPDAALVHHL